MEESLHPTLIVIDSSYTFDIIESRQLKYSVTSRDLNGYFGHVYSVNPLASALMTKNATKGSPIRTEHLAERHTFIETGASGHWVQRIPGVGRPLDFLMSQLRLMKHLRRIGLSNQWVAVRAGDPLYCGLFGLVLARQLRCPLVVRVGSNNDQVRMSTGRAVMPRLLRFGAVERRVEHLVLSRADAVMGANADNCEWAIKAGARPEVSTIIRYGNLIAPDHFTDPTHRGSPDALLQDHGINSTTPLILYVGRLEPVKRAVDVVEVADRLQQRGASFKCFIIGDGSQRSILEKVCHDRGLDSKIHFLGNLDQPKLAQLFAMAACVVSPHTGRALGEAALAGAPIAAYDIDWQGELITNEETGRLVSFANVEELGDAALDLLLNPDKARRLGAAARSRAHEMLNPHIGNVSERNIYSRLLSHVQSTMLE